jgi:hypothetical protein
MPSGKNWVKFLYVNLAFAIYIAGVLYYNQVAEIKANWPLYRCNPMYMPLADDMKGNLVYCTQSIKTNFMSYLLKPLIFLFGSLGEKTEKFINEISSIRDMFNKITIGIKDLIGKTIGTMDSFMYVMDGSIKTINSTWNGPPGQMGRVLGKCFHPNTHIKLLNGTTKAIKDVELGDILQDGSIVESVMKIDNKRDPVPLYVIKNNGVDSQDIFVTGSHLVFDETSNNFIKVENYSKASQTNSQSEWFSCLITSNHKIQIGNEIFWDWEDHFVKNDYRYF